MVRVELTGCPCAPEKEVRADIKAFGPSDWKNGTAVNNEFRGLGLQAGIRIPFRKWKI